MAVIDAGPVVVVAPGGIRAARVGKHRAGEHQHHQYEDYLHGHSLQNTAVRRRRVRLVLGRFYKAHEFQHLLDLVDAHTIGRLSYFLRPL